LSYFISVFGWRRRAFAGLLLALLASIVATAPASAAVKFGGRLLQLGTRGADVTTLQRDLTAAGYATTVTGIFTSQTKLDVLSFQRHYRLSTDGVVGPTTYSKLTSILHTLANLPDTAIAASSKNIPKGLLGPQPTTATTAESAPLPASDTGGVGMVPPPTDAPFQAAGYDSLTGLVQPPASAPAVIQKVIEGANAIAFKPYVYGGGHGSFNSAGYDCSGSVSYALHAAGLLATPLDSTQFESYGDPGPGRWITIYADAGHAYMQVAGVWFDTAAQSAQNGNDRWSRSRISPAGGFVVRHPAGW